MIIFKKSPFFTDYGVLNAYSPALMKAKFCNIKQNVHSPLSNCLLWWCNVCVCRPSTEKKQKPVTSRVNVVPAVCHSINPIGNEKHWDSTYLCQGTSYQCHDTDPDLWPGSPLKFNHFFHWPIANLPWKFHASLFGSFYAKLLADRQTDKQRWLHILLGGGNN